jgi:hypothetical protein
MLSVRRTAALAALVGVALVIVARGPAQRTAQLLESEQHLERDIAALKAQLAARSAAAHHPHPRIRQGVFGKTLRELSGAIQALAGTSSAPAPVDHVSAVSEALRSGAAPRAQLSSATATAGSLIKRLEKRESRTLEKAQRIEHEIKEVKERRNAMSRQARRPQRSGARPAVAAPISITINKYYEEPRGRRHGRANGDGLTKIAAAERRASAVLTSLRLKQDTENDARSLMMLKQENCSLAQQFDTNLTTLPLIENEDECALPNVWDAENEECVASPIGAEGDEPVV